MKYLLSNDFKFYKNQLFDVINLSSKEFRILFNGDSDYIYNVKNQKDFKKHFPELDQDDKLKKVPQGFDKEDPMAEYLKLKNFIVLYHLKDEEVLDKNAVKNMGKIFKLMKPFNDFLNMPFFV